MSERFLTYTTDFEVRMLIEHSEELRRLSRELCADARALRMTCEAQARARAGTRSRERDRDDASVSR